MKRSGFFAALLAPLAAWAHREWPKNGQCPIPTCGTMAKPYLKLPGTGHYAMNMETGKREEVWYDREINCARCRVDFQQSAEDPK